MAFRDVCRHCLVDMTTKGCENLSLLILHPILFHDTRRIINSGVFSTLPPAATFSIRPELRQNTKLGRIAMFFPASQENESLLAAFCVHVYRCLEGMSDGAGDLCLQSPSSPFLLVIYQTLWSLSHSLEPLLCTRHSVN